jgi:hypothetical protein
VSSHGACQATSHPDLDGFGVFKPAIPDLVSSKISKQGFPAIPRSDLDLTPKDHLQAIANTAAFHFASIEQGGTSLYPTQAQRVTNSPAQYRPDRGDAFPNLARQSRQCTTANGPHQWAHLPGPQ